MRGAISERRQKNTEVEVEKNCNKQSKNRWSRYVRREQDESKQGAAVKQAKGINTLIEISLAGVNAMEEFQEWEEVEMAVDSGATETVVGEDMIKGIETKQGEAARRGVQYEGASGELIPNLGEKNFLAYGEQGQIRAIKAQVCEVNKALMSVSRMVQAGNKVVFAGSGSYVEDENTGERISLREQGGMYMAKLWVKSQSFRGQAEESW